MLAMPMIGNVGFEVWRAKEANISSEEEPGWASRRSAASCGKPPLLRSLPAGGMNILVMRHPRAVELVKKSIDELMRDNSY